MRLVIVSAFVHQDFMMITQQTQTCAKAATLHVSNAQVRLIQIVQREIRTITCSHRQPRLIIVCHLAPMATWETILLNNVIYDMPIAQHVVVRFIIID